MRRCIQYLICELFSLCLHQKESDLSYLCFTQLHSLQEIKKTVHKDVASKYLVLSTKKDISLFL